MNTSVDKYSLGTESLKNVEAEVHNVRELLQASKYRLALDSVQALKSRVPENRDVLYMEAVALRFLGRVTEAFDALKHLEQQHPKYSRLYQERGYCYLQQRDPFSAITWFERAVHVNPALPASWQALRLLYKATAQANNEGVAATNLESLSRLPPPVTAAYGLFHDGESAEAERVIRQYLLAYGDHVEAMRLLALLGVQQDVLDDAELLLSRALSMEPDHRPARYEYVTVLLKRHKHRQAREHIETLIKADPRNRSYRAAFATICAGLGDHARALEEYAKLSEEFPDDPELHLSIGHVQKTLGLTAAAVEAYRRAIERRPTYGEAFWSLANLKTYHFSEEEVQALRSHADAAAISAVDQYHLCFSLGKALEDRQEYNEAFQFYERGNKLKRLECKYRAETMEANTRDQQAVCTPAFFAARGDFGISDSGPIFVVGLPRSGSTLVEQILASHSQVEGTMELADIPRLVQDLQGPTQSGRANRYPQILQEVSQEAVRIFAERYMTETRVYRQGKPFFIDKMPNNFRHLGLIRLMFPNAKIIDVRRDPVACCFSNFKQLFASGQQFTYSLEDIGRYYRTYVELMGHWDRVLPGYVFRVQYEELVDNFEPLVRRLLQFCGLEFESACMEFHRTARQVHTASAQQVREPLNRRGLDQWRHFEPWLDPLLHLLPEAAPNPNQISSEG
jgi:tetratricopeptide (TPR) repeat protein